MIRSNKPSSPQDDHVAGEKHKVSPEISPFLCDRPKYRRYPAAVPSLELSARVTSSGTKSLSDNCLNERSNQTRRQARKMITMPGKQQISRAVRRLGRRLCPPASSCGSAQRPPSTLPRLPAAADKPPKSAGPSRRTAQSDQDHVGDLVVADGPARGGRSSRHPARGVSCCAPCCAPAASSLGRSLRSRLAISIHPPALPQSLLKVPPDRTTGRVALVVSRLKRSRAVAEHGEPAERTALGLSGSVVVERVQRRTVLTAVGFHTSHFSVQLGSVCTVCALSSLNAISVPRCKRSLRLSENSVCERAT